MSAATLLLSAAVSLAACVAFALVARRLRQRSADPERRHALLLFAFAWHAMAATAAAAAAMAALAAAGVRDLAVFLALQHAFVLAITIGLFALTYYFLFVFTGRAAVVIPVSLFYALYYVFILNSLAASDLTLRVGDFRAELAPVGDLGPTLLLIFVAGALPPMLGALLHLTLIPRLGDATATWRISLVSTAVFLWIGGGLVSRLAGSEVWFFATRPLGGLVVAAVVVSAYVPPAWARRRFGLRGLGPKGQEVPAGSP